MMYSRTFFSKEELESALSTSIDPIELNRILSAYDMADMAYSDKKAMNGSSYFFHTTRVCKILCTELDVKDPDLLICSLLHDIFEACSEITPEIIDYNFGPYTAHILMILKEDYKSVSERALPPELDVQRVRLPEDDYLIIWLAEHLDNFRSLEVTPLFNPINYILNIVSVLFPIAEKSNNPLIQKLLHELKQERNKILG
ncbi:MAG: hypothetical protein RBT61_11040 [Candidatus Kapabacteria bacterium]|nr:hypothetical protein [Candidatus Kapabacteria bacterium]